MAAATRGDEGGDAMGQRRTGEGNKGRVKLSLNKETLEELATPAPRARAVKGGMPMLPLPSRWSKCKCYA
jgi:hypothetical protein